jgi:hypothetical protein
MPRQHKDARRERWMCEFEEALREACAAAKIEFSAGRIDWASPTYHYGIGTPAQTAAGSYIVLHLTPEK